MNSYISVEEQEIECDEFESLVLSASSISGSSIDSEKSGVDIFSSKESTPDDECANFGSSTYVVCMGGTRAHGKRKVSDEKFVQGVGSEFYQQSKPSVQFANNLDSKLMPIDISGNYDNCNSLEFDYLPFETVLMNYPEEVDYFDLDEKILNSSVPEGGGFDPFESETDVSSFEGFSDQSSSSFEGFLEKSTKNKAYKSKSKFYSKIKGNRVRTNSESDSSCEINSKPQLKVKLSKPSSFDEDSDYYDKSFHKYLDKKYKTKDKLKSSPTKENLRFLSSTPLSETSRSHQNYSKGVISPIYSSGNKKFKEKINVPRGEQQKSKEKIDQSQGETSTFRTKNKVKDKVYHVKPKIRLDRSAKHVVMETSESVEHDNLSESYEIPEEVMEKYNKMGIDVNQNNMESLNFSDNDSDAESFEGFESELNIKVDNVIIGSCTDTIKKQCQVAKVKEEKIDLDDFIGSYCDNIGCTVSWLESRNPMIIPHKITNGVVFELNEFAKKIAWETHYVADWIFRLRGYININVENEDMKKINSTLKRRRALTVNFAGYLNLKSKLRKFDLESFSLPTIERLEKENDIKDRIDSNNLVESQNDSNIFGESQCDKVNSELKTNISNKIKSSVIENKITMTKNEEVPETIGDKSDYSKRKYSECIENDQNRSSDFHDDNDTDQENQDESFNGLIREQNSSSPQLTTSDSDLSDILHDHSDSDTNDYSETISALKYNKENSEDNLKQLGIGSENIMSSKGRIRKPTAKAQELFSQRQMGTYSPLQPQILLNLTSKESKVKSADLTKTKLLHPMFVDDGKIIGSHCNKNEIDIKFLNSTSEAKYPLTNGIVYELYHFFRERKASLTSLVHTLYRLKNKPIDKSQIIATMAKIHELVKVMWNELIDRNCNMPYEEFSFNCEKNRGNIDLQPCSSLIDKKTKLCLEPSRKRHKQTIQEKSSTKESEYSESDTNSFSSEVCHLAPSLLEPESKVSNESLPMNKSFDLNSTKGNFGKITRGDIVYLYTKWLKKKMEGHSDVFVTDLSKDVEELINERKVGCLRVPVGTLMSSSVKLFEEFRKLSKISMAEAKAYLLGNWIKDIEILLNTSNKKKLLPETVCDTNECSSLSLEQNLKIHQSDNSLQNSYIGSSKTDNENNLNNPILPEKAVSDLNETSKLKVSKVKEPLIKNVPEDYEVEKIVGYRIVKIGDESVTEYRIRWFGYSSKDDSWINEADLNCPDILDKFWEALNKQRALKNKKNVVRHSLSRPIDDKGETLKPSHFEKNSNESVNMTPCSIFKEKESKCTSDLKTSLNEPDEFVNSTLVGKDQEYQSGFSLITKQGNKISKDVEGQENISPFFGRDNVTSRKFFSLMIENLKPNLVDYCHEEERPFIKRVKVTKGEILDIYDKWRHQNQEHLLTGGNQKLNVNALISRIKDLAEVKKVRNFNPNSILDVCYRMSLMKEKLKDPLKVNEYLTGDFMELIQTSQKHQEFLRLENSLKLKKMKLNKLATSENLKTSSKINEIYNLQKESLIIAKYLEANKSNHYTYLESEITAMKGMLKVEREQEDLIEKLKRENVQTVRELESCGVEEDTLNDLLHIALKIFN